MHGKERILEAFHSVLMKDSINAVVCDRLPVATLLQHSRTTVSKEIKCCRLQGLKCVSSYLRLRSVLCSLRHRMLILQNKSRIRSMPCLKPR